MGLGGTIIGGGLGFAAGGPGGALIGAGAGNMLEDSLFPGEAPSTTVTPGAPVSYAGTGYDYAGGMQAADRRETWQRPRTLADQDRDLAMRARQMQEQELERLRATARGEGPSAAAMQMQAAQEQAAAQAANIAASARGTSGQAMASRDAMRAQQLGAQTSARDTAIIRAQEALQAQQAATGLVSNMRGQANQERAQSLQDVQHLEDMYQRALGQNDARAMALLQAQIEEAKARAGVASGNSQRETDAARAQMQAEQAAYQAQKDRSQRMSTGLMAGGAAAGSAMLAGQGGGSAPAGGGTGGSNANSGNAPAPFSYNAAQNGSY